MKKKIFAFILVLASLGTSAFAADYDFLDAQYNSYEASVSISLELKKPLSIIKYLDMGEVDNFLDLTAFFTSLEKSTSEETVKADIDFENKRIKMSVEGNSVIPATINGNFRLTADLTTGLWIDFDLSDSENPACIYMAQTPYLRKYLKFDLLEIADAEETDALLKTLNKMLELNL